MQKHPVDAATSAFDLLGGYPGGRIRADGEAGGTSEAAGSGRMGSKRLKGSSPLGDRTRYAIKVRHDVKCAF